MNPPISHVIFWATGMGVVGFGLGGVLGDAEPAVFLSAVVVLALVSAALFIRLER